VGNGETISVTATELGDRIPLFVKEGAVIPMLSDSVNQVQSAIGHSLEVRWYGKQAGACDLYEDDGQTFDYERGASRRRRFNVSKDQDGKIALNVTVTNQSQQAMFGEVERFVIMTK
jgi:alpha-glucosidase (family GH31 glycosyl hydrolase)